MLVKLEIHLETLMRFSEGLGGDGEKVGHTNESEKWNNRIALRFKTQGKESDSLSEGTQENYWISVIERSLN